MILEKKTTSESRESTVKMKGEFLQTLYNYYAMEHFKVRFIAKGVNELMFTILQHILPLVELEKLKCLNYDWQITLSVVSK